MSNHAPKIDLGSKLMFVISLVAILLTVYVLVNSLINTFQKNMTKGELDSSMKVAAVADNLKPVGSASASDASATSAAPAAARSGKEVYDAVCTACHTAGVAGAPKFGDKAAWEPRVANGLDGLMNTAINGKGAMPPRAGQNVPDNELKAAILYMTKEAGFDLGGAAAAAPAKAEAPATATPAETAPATAAPAEQAAPAANTNAAAPATTEAPATTAAAPATQEKPAAEKTAASSDNALAEGENVYKSVCFACHATGVANAPLLGNKELWAPRIATGKESLYNSALHGKGAMPPKGGNLALEDAKIKAAVDYMVSKAQ